jgi:hypothetical protein
VTSVRFRTFVIGFNQTCSIFGTVPQKEFWSTRQIMLVAFIKCGEFETKDITLEDTGVDVLPIFLFADALAILGRAIHEEPSIDWEILGGGPYGVFEKAGFNLNKKMNMSEN